MKILFLVPYPTEGASNRIRVEQYLPYFKNNRIKYKIRPFMSQGFYKVIYLKGHFVIKLLYFIKSSLVRLCDIFAALNYDLVFIHREAFPIGPPFIEYILRFLRKPIIFDFDDAIFLPNTSQENALIEKLKMPQKVKQIVGMSSHVVAGNNYLRDFASRYNKNITIIPSAADTEAYRPKQRDPNRKKIVIGWVGSNTTAGFLKMLEGVFKKLANKYENLEFRFIGGNPDIRDLPNVVYKSWSLEYEAKELQDFDIGIMPMPDNEWTKGKCSFKAILYMSVGIPCVCSAVGMNKEIIQDGLNGFLVNSENEWFKKFSLLIEDPGLREKIGLAGRKAVLENFSVSVNAPKYLEVFRNVYEK